jgi:hypothetical protein
MKTSKGTSLKCSICNVKIADRRLTCNAMPLNDGRCCIACDNMLVTPARIARATGMPIRKAIVCGLAINDAVLGFQNRKDK